MEVKRNEVANGLILNKLQLLVYSKASGWRWRPQQWCNFPGTPTPATPGWAAHLRRLA